jgi:hypothetical protein
LNTTFLLPFAGCWKFEVEIKETYIKKKYSSIENSRKVVLQHFEDFEKKGNLLVVLMFDIFLSKNFECI